MTLDDLVQYKKTIEAAQDDYDAAKEKYVEEHCPYRVGDDIEIQGYTFRGKIGLITRIGLRHNHWRKEKDFEWTISVDVKKKDGTVGERWTTFRIPVKGD